MVLVCSYYHLRFLALRGGKAKEEMRKTISVLVLVLAGALLGGCAGGGITSGSLLPSTAGAHHLDSVGGGPPLVNPKSHPLDSVGGGPPLPKLNGLRRRRAALSESQISEPQIASA